MTRSRWILVLCLLGFFFSSAISADAGLFSSDDDLVEYEGPNAGVLVLSLGAYRGVAYSVYRLFFRSHDGHKTASLTYSRTARPDYSNDYIAGAVRTYSLEPGEYEIYDFELSFANGSFIETFSSKEPFSIPFTIKPKQAVYLGEFRAVSLSGQGLLGFADTGAKFQLSDRSARDVPIAKTQNSRVTDVEIKIPEPPSPSFERMPTDSHP